MKDQFKSQSALMAELSISALVKASNDPKCWYEPVIHSTILLSGLYVLLECSQILRTDLKID